MSAPTHGGLATPSSGALADKPADAPLGGAAPGDSTAPSGAPPERSLKLISIVLAVACGLTVANLYYAQPLLGLIGSTFGTDHGTTAIVVTATQLGYAAGLAFVLPLGDVLANRSLAWRMLLVTSAALVGIAFAPSFAAFVALSVLVGVTSVVAQILVPFAATLAPPAQRGAFVGRVMSGLLIGILLARSFSSLVAAQFGWHAIYLISALLMLVLSAVLARLLPHREPAHTAGYRRLLASVGELVRDEPALRRRAVCQALMFGAFTCYWTAIAYELIDVHGLSQDAIALFALVGAGGAAAAPLAGRIGDRGLGRAASAVAICLAALAMGLARLDSGSVVALAVAGVLLDVAVQGHQVLSQQEIYALRPDARARINTAYMTTVFLGGALASALTGVIYHLYGWNGVTIFAMLLPLAALGVWFTGVRRRATR